MADDLTLEKFMEFYAAYSDDHRYQRAGQAAFNALQILDPKIADEIRGHPDLDPFYKDIKLVTFSLWLARRLEGKDAVAGSST